MTRTCPSTLQMALSTTPLLACESTSGFSRIYRPWISAFLRPTSSTKCLMAGSWSGLTMTSWPSIPHSCMNAQTLSTTNFPVLLDGTAVDIVILVFRSRATSMVRVWPASPSSPMKA